MNDQTDKPCILRVCFGATDHISFIELADYIQDDDYAVEIGNKMLNYTLGEVYTWNEDQQPWLYEEWMIEDHEEFKRQVIQFANNLST